MNNVFANKSKLLLIVLVGLSFCLLNAKISRAASWGSPSSWLQTGAAPGKEAQEKPGAEAQAFKKNVEQLKSKRDDDIAALLKERNAKIQALQDAFKELSQKEVAKIKQDKQAIQQRMMQGQDMKKAQALLMQQEQALRQQSLNIQKQANTIKLTYDQQIQKLTQAYAQQFAILQQQMPTGK